MLLAVLATLGNVGLLTAAAVAWPGAASRARGGNRVHVAQLEAREGRRCWPLAAPPAPSCDAAARFVDELTAHPEPGGWAVAAEQALACRCLSSLGAHGAFVRLLGQPSTSDATAWAHGPERNRILLASRLVTVEDLPTFSARATEWGYTATSRPESFPDAIRTLRELVVWFDAPETRDRLLVMHAVTSGLAFASSSLDVTDLASHDRAARVFALPALLDACSPARACEDPLVLGGHLASTDVAIATEVVRATRNELERVIRWLEDRWREWAMIQTALVAAQGADEPETSAPLRSRIRTGEIELRGSLPRGLAGRASSGGLAPSSEAVTRRRSPGAGSKVTCGCSSSSRRAAR
jgi:hypothetical protein